MLAEQLPGAWLVLHWTDETLLQILASDLILSLCRDCRCDAANFQKVLRKLRLASHIERHSYTQADTLNEVSRLQTIYHSKGAFENCQWHCARKILPSQIRVHSDATDQRTSTIVPVRNNILAKDKSLGLCAARSRSFSACGPSNIASCQISTKPSPSYAPAGRSPNHKCENCAIAHANC